ncbi:hypothetical protein SAY87_007732 [Trapa incisa]|uniref:Prolamin-like domain-containing protein n=1 Tax=Trapa incisa TaxID=236973 RepID=A0AAN7KMR8_9MYRT|nr:hypothetical protein SAY87_007732 [Trapa incisa]
MEGWTYISHQTLSEDIIIEADMEGHISWWRLTMIVVVLAMCRVALLVEGRSNFPWEGEELPPEPRKGWNEFIMNCAKRLTNGCDQQLYDFIFMRREELEIYCCYKLTGMGETCYRAIAHTMSSIERFKLWKGHIYLRSMEGYEDCVRRA